jgi:hypothetical protein
MLTCRDHRVLCASEAIVNEDLQSVFEDISEDGQYDHDEQSHQGDDDFFRQDELVAMPSWPEEVTSWSVLLEQRDNT